MMPWRSLCTSSTPSRNGRSRGTRRPSACSTGSPERHGCNASAPSFISRRRPSSRRRVTAGSSDPAHSFVSRYFAPRIGIPEDQVTGSAHCALGPFWAERLRRQRVVGLQVSTRGGVVEVWLDRAPGQVYLIGHAVTVLE